MARPEGRVVRHTAVSQRGFGKSGASSGGIDRVDCGVEAFVDEINSPMAKSMRIAVRFAEDVSCPPGKNTGRLLIFITLKVHE